MVVLKQIRNLSPKTDTVIITGFGTIATAVEAMNMGAYDYVPKPFDNEELKQTIAKALDLKTIEHEKEIIEALYADLNKTEIDAYATEIGIIESPNDCVGLDILVGPAELHITVLLR